MLEGAESGPYADVETELDIQGCVIRRFIWYKGGRDNAQVHGAGGTLWEATWNIQTVGNVYLTEWLISVSEFLNLAPGEVRMKNGL